MKTDFFIVGQGLAGSLLAYELINRGKTVLVFDDPCQIKASEVAAGLVNPIGFRRMTKSWMADEVFPVLESTFSKLENLLHQKFYYREPILRILSEDSLLTWKTKAFANKLEAYIELNPLINYKCIGLDKYSSFGLVKRSGRFDISGFILSFAEFLKSKRLLIPQKFEYSKLNLFSDHVSYDSLVAKKVIFCEGPAASANPFFRTLIFKHSKGEILDVEFPEFNLEKTISRDIFIIPLGKHRYKIGATYSWTQLDFIPTILGRNELLNKLQMITSVPYTVVKHMAGVRPTMNDRKPVLGFHPHFPQIGIFNGLGSKGVLLGPYFANNFAEFLTENTVSIYPEVNIERYFLTRK